MIRCYSVTVFIYFLFKQKTAYEMRISDWSSDVCSSDLSQSASAQSRPLGQDTIERAQESADDVRIEEIIVTAQKREQSLNSVGLTVTAISGEALAERNQIGRAHV